MSLKWRGAGVLMALVAVGCDDSNAVIGGDADVATDAADVVAVDTPTSDQPAADVGFDTGARDVPADTGSADTGVADAGQDSGIADVGVDVGTDNGQPDAGFVDTGDDVPVDVGDDAGDDHTGPTDAGEDGGPSCAMTTCGGACVDTQTDINNCGSCGNACCAGSVCSSGACVMDCSAGVTFCGTACTAGSGCFHVLIDVNHCGGCDVVCPAVAGATPTCTSATCGFTCNAGLGDCDAATAGCETDVTTSLAHCGACGHACGLGQTCTAGACVDLPCPTAGDLRCGGVCINPQTSASHCGSCDLTCAAATGATAVCAAGACGLACIAGLGNCDGSASNGCETDVTTSANNCGACGVACGTGLTCLSGRCERTTCLPPTASCSGTACPACTSVAFAEDWESGTSRWNLARGGSTAIVTQSDASDCHGSYLRETELYSAGRVFTQSSIPVTAGATYCMSSWIRGSTGTWPFVGIRESSPTAALGTEHWLIGQPCFSTALPPPVAPVTSDGTWRWYSREFTMPATSNILIEIEIWSGGAAGTADFDQVQVLAGPCPAVNPPSVCAAATCGS